MTTMEQESNNCTSTTSNTTPKTILGSSYDLNKDEKACNSSIVLNINSVDIAGKGGGDPIAEDPQKKLQQKRHRRYIHGTLILCIIISILAIIVILVVLRKSSRIENNTIKNNMSSNVTSVDQHSTIQSITEIPTITPTTISSKTTPMPAPTAANTSKTPVTGLTLQPSNIMTLTIPTSINNNNNASSMKPFVTKTQVPTTTVTKMPATSTPVSSPTALPTMDTNTVQLSSITTTFSVIADLPYSKEQEKVLRDQIADTSNDSNIEFIVHLGDIRSAEHERKKCEEHEYTNVGSILQLSSVPVFVILGDNDWNDCPNSDDALGYWEKEFLQFESRHWNVPFKIQRLPSYPADFAFVHKGTLFIGLNIVGGNAVSNAEWNQRLTTEVDWTKALITNYTSKTFLDNGIDAGHRVVIFGHADPTPQHNRFFEPLRDYILYELNNQIPILYMNGDHHEWLYEPLYMNQPSFLRIMVTGLGKEPPLKMTVTADASLTKVYEAFVYDRQL